MSDYSEHLISKAGGDGPSITGFLLARIEEDETAARECLTLGSLTPYGDSRIPPVSPEEWGGLVDNYLGGPMGKHCGRHDPARVLAECAAKRRILYTFPLPGGPTNIFGWVGRDIMRYLAAVYKDHADYQEEWAA